MWNKLPNSFSMNFSDQPFNIKQDSNYFQGSFQDNDIMDISPMDISPMEILPIQRENQNGEETFFSKYRIIINMPGYSIEQRTENFAALMELERIYIFNDMTKNQFCDSFSNIKDTRGIKKLNLLLDNQVENPNLYGWVFCSINEAFTNGDYDFNGNVGEIRNMINSLTVLTRIGTFGALYAPDIRNITDLMRIKIFNPLDPKYSYFDEMSHEFFIGYQLNKLRSKIPNFMYVYGMFKCGKPQPDIADFEDPVSPCPDFLGTENTNNSRNYLLMEIVKPPQFKNPGYDMYDFCQDDSCNPNKFMSLYFQIIFSIYIAYIELDFTHYDLHGANVMIQKTKNNELIFIPYSYNGNVIYIKARGIAKIIDYGRSHVNIFYEGNIMGFGNVIQQYGTINPYRSNPMYDIYKITGFLLRTLINGGKEPKKTFMAVYGIIKSFRPFDQTMSYKEVIDTIDREYTNNKFEYFSHIHGQDYLINNPRLAFERHIDYILINFPEYRDNVWFLNPTIDREFSQGRARILQCTDNCIDWDSLNTEF